MKTKLMMTVFFGLLTLTAAGCAHQQYAQQPYPVEYDSTHVAECKLEALKATASAGVGSIATPYQAAGTIANDIATGMRQGEIMAACLEIKRKAAAVAKFEAAEKAEAEAAAKSAAAQPVAPLSVTP